MLKFDFIIVGAGSAGAVLATRLSERFSVLVLEAGGNPPPAELVPAACVGMQLNPATDYMYVADAGKCGLGFKDQGVGKMRIPQGKMLGGSSGLNYMAYVRGHPGDFDEWEAKHGAKGWSFSDVLPFFKKSEGIQVTDSIQIDKSSHGVDGPLKVSVRSPVIDAARDFVKAAASAGIAEGDFNGSARRNPAGVSSLMQTTTFEGKRCSTFRAFLEPKLQGQNITVITEAMATSIIWDGTTARGVVYEKNGETQRVYAGKEVIISSGTFGSAKLLLLSGVGPAEDLRKLNIKQVVDNPHVGKNLKDHIQVPLFFANVVGAVSMLDVALSLGPDALRAPRGPFPSDPKDDDSMPPPLQGLKTEALRRLGEWAQTGKSFASSSLYDAACWFSTTGSLDTHDAQIAAICAGYDALIWEHVLNISEKDFLGENKLAPTATNLILLANVVRPKSSGYLKLASVDPKQQPAIQMNYFDNPKDLEVMKACIRKALEIAQKWPGNPISWVVPPLLAKKHNHIDGFEPSDALLTDLILHYSLTVYHPTSTCSIGKVVDESLRVINTKQLRVVDASVMPDIVSGNTNAATIMIAEKAADKIFSELI